MNTGLFITSIVILLCILLNRVSRKIGIPMLLGFILLGMLFGSDGILKIPFENYKLAEDICSSALIFIMFYGGFGTNWKTARPVAVKSICLSTLGVILTAFLTGMFCYLILHISLLESLLIGSVISSTDAASVFSILQSKNMGLKYHTASMLEIESGSNDPCSYMLTAILLSIMGNQASTGKIVYLIFSQLVYGILFGFLIAFLARKFLEHFEFATPGFDTTFMVALALVSYALPSLIGGNGYMSTYIVGIILGNTKIKGKKSMVHFFDGITGLMQMLIFFLLGLLATPSKLPEIFFTALFIALCLTFIARPAAVFAILSPFKCKKEQMLLVSFAGLRGAASIVFAIMATVDDAYTSMDLFHIVFCIVLLSILFQGTFLSSFAKKLKMSDENEDIRKTFSDYSEEVDLQFIQLLINENHPWCLKPVKELILPPDALIIMILRDKKRIIPNGETILYPKDTVILSARIFAEPDSLSLTELRIDSTSPWIGNRISDFSPYAGELVIMIIRGEETIVPNGDTIILDKDLLVIYSSAKYKPDFSS